MSDLMFDLVLNKNLVLIEEILVQTLLSRSIKYLLILVNALQGPLAFYKGFIPNFSRIGIWNVIMFLTLEQVRYLDSVILTYVL